MSFPYPPRENDRIAVLHRLGILDTAPSAAFERICSAARHLFHVPMVAVSLIDRERQWFKARQGIEIQQTSRDLAFCNYTILHDEVFVVPDAASDARFANNPLVTGPPHIRFYAGAPLVTEPGIRVGSLCIIDHKPRSLDPSGMRTLATLARLALDEIWFHHLEHSGLVPAFCPGEGRGGGRRHDPDFGIELPLTGAQIRAARGLVNWSVRELAAASGVSPMSIKRMEIHDGKPPVRSQTLQAVRRALEEAGAEFLASPGHPPGIRPRQGRFPPCG